MIDAETGEILNNVPPNSDFTPLGFPALNLSEIAPCDLGKNCTSRKGIRLLDRM